MSKGIYWVSRHDPLPAQIEELCRLFGPNTRVIPDPKPFSSALEIVDRFRASGAAEMVVVAPLSVLARICETGVKPLWAQMELVGSLSNPKSETIVNGRVYRFKEFRRVVRVEVVTEPVSEPKSPSKRLPADSNKPGSR